MRREAPDEPEQLAHDRAASDHAAELGVPRDLLFGFQQAPAAFRIFPHLRQEMCQASKVERLCEVVDGSKLDGLDGAVDRRIAAHENHLTIRIRFPNRAQDFDAADIGQAQIDRREIGVMVFELRKRLRTARTRHHLETRVFGEPSD